MIRKTRQRAAIREAFESSGRPLSPEEVLAYAQQSVDGLGIATVYRNIRTLVDEGWLTTVDLPGESSRYELAGKGHHHHFHCQACGRVFELEGCAATFRGMVPPDFQVTGHEVVLYGNCGECRSLDSAAG